MKLTGKRADKRDELLIGARASLIDWNVYRKRVETLERQEKKLIQAQKDRAAARERKEEEKRKEKEAKILENRKAGVEKRKATLLAKKEAASLAGQLIRKFQNVDTEVSIRDMWKYMKSSSLNDVRIVSDGFDKTVSFADYKKFRLNFVEGGSDGDFIISGVILLVKPSNIEAKKLMQKFRDGVEHCVFVPIVNKLMEKMENSSSKESKKRYMQRLAKLEEYRAAYEAGVPEDMMEEVARASGMCITINDVVGNVIKCFNENGKVGVLRMTNTRENHLEEGSMVMNQDFIEVSESAMEKIWKEAKKGKKGFYHVEGDIKNDMPSKLKFLGESYKLGDSEKDILNQFSKEIELEKYRFNATKFPKVNEFIKAGRIVNGWATELNGGDATGHIDMPKAYAQFKKCEFYSGFMGVVQQWRSGDFSVDWIKENIGMYQFVITSCNDELFNSLGMTVGSVHVLPSPEILYFVSRGVDVKIVAGVWGSRIDFEFPEYMLENRRYCLWSGRTAMEKNDKSYTFPGSAEFAAHLKATLGEEKVLFWGDKGLITIKVPVKNVFTTHHILGFITSYVRIQMLEAMKQFDFSQLVKVVMDGIYFKGEMPSGLDWFVEKEMKDHTCLEKWYDGFDEAMEWKPVVYGRNTCIAGQGGAGKTYGIMTDGCYNNILYVAPQHILGQRVREQYGANYTTYHQLVGIDCQPYIQKFSYPPVIVLDELTQIESAWIEKAFSMYKDSLILVLGDIDKDGMWYQTRNGKPGMYSQTWTPDNVDFVVVEGDRRSKDQTLKNLKMKLREVMRKGFIDGNSGEEFMMISWAKQFLNIVSFEDACLNFKNGEDTWIAGTHKTNSKLLEKGVVSGWYKKGGWVSFAEKDGYEKRGSFSIHSYQGSTIENGKVYISIHDLFEFTMLYTAVSRAVNFSQLVFVDLK